MRTCGSESAKSSYAAALLLLHLLPCGEAIPRNRLLPAGFLCGRGSAATLSDARAWSEIPSIPVASHTRNHNGLGFIRPVDVTIFATPDAAVAKIPAIFVAITNLQEGSAFLVL